MKPVLLSRLYLSVRCDELFKDFYGSRRADLNLLSLLATCGDLPVPSEEVLGIINKNKLLFAAICTF